MALSNKNNIISDKVRIERTLQYINSNTNKTIDLIKLVNILEGNTK